jgi:SAM-dependent methyltransferase
VVEDELQVRALRELGRVVKPGGTIRLLEYVRPTGAWRRFLAGLWEPWMAWAYGASFDRNTQAYIGPAGLDLVEARFVVDDLIKLMEVRVPTASARA